MDIQNLINKAYTDIQNLQLQPSRHNTMLLAEAMLNLEQASQQIKAITDAMQEQPQETAPDQPEEGVADGE